MSKLSKVSAIASLAFFACGNLAVAVAPTAAHAASQNTCRLYANTPTFSGSTITSSGGRTGCLNSATATLLVKRDVEWLPDSVLATVSKTGQTFTLTGTSGGATTGHAYYTEVYSSNNSLVQSGRVVK
ncbi:hypothetical protein JT358_08685 [Micrococcales bacterium 31B]|nr:hypothetical protein [Micrococcales bacterium 31B]